MTTGDIIKTVAAARAGNDPNIAKTLRQRGTRKPKKAAKFAEKALDLSGGIQTQILADAAELMQRSAGRKPLVRKKLKRAGVEKAVKTAGALKKLARKTRD